MSAVSRLLPFGLAVVLGGCGIALPPPGPGPVVLPPPDEADRVSHPAGYSIVFPPNLEAEVNSAVFRGESFTRDALSNRVPLDANGLAPRGAPKLSVRRLSDLAIQSNGGRPVPSHFQPTRFQNRPAFANFDPGYGPRSQRAKKNRTGGTAGGYFPNLQQELIFERDGEWFHLTFSMHNLRENETVHQQPLPGVQAYFETFEYSPPDP